MTVTTSRQLARKRLYDALLATGADSVEARLSVWVVHLPFISKDYAVYQCDSVRGLDSSSREVKDAASSLWTATRVPHIVKNLRSN